MQAQILLVKSLTFALYGHTIIIFQAFVKHRTINLERASNGLFYLHIKRSAKQYDPLCGHQRKPLQEIWQSTPKNSWIAELMDNELLPTLTIIERGLDRSNALDREDSWIKFYTKQYGPLLNVSERGKSYAEYDPIRPAQVHIRDIRIAKMLSQRDLGDLAKVSASVISRIEHGGYVPPFEVIERIAIALDVEVSEIYNNDKLA